MERQSLEVTGWFVKILNTIQDKQYYWQLNSRCSLNEKKYPEVQKRSFQHLISRHLHICQEVTDSKSELCSLLCSWTWNQRAFHLACSPVNHNIWFLNSLLFSLEIILSFRKYKSKYCFHTWIKRADNYNRNGKNDLHKNVHQNSLT